MQKARRHSTDLHQEAPTACRRRVSGSVSLPCSGCFSPFPHGTISLSVSQPYLALPDGTGRFGRDSSGPALLRIRPRSTPSPLRGFHALWHPFPGASGKESSLLVVLQPRMGRNPPGLGFSALARRYARNHWLVFSSSAYLDVSVQRVRPIPSLR